MKVRRGKKAKYLVCAETGLLKDSAWKRTLEGYPTVLVCSIRKELARRIPGLSEKFNRKSRYFGYWTDTDNDRAYIFVQKKNLCILLCISRDFEAEVRKTGFDVRFINNFQGRAGWLTGLYVPHTTKNVGKLMKWLLKAF
jgi:hypothetical protein